MKRATRIFNIAAVGLYGITEVLQDYAKNGMNVYDVLPFGGQALQFHLSGFFGAAALNWAATTILKDYVEKAYKEAAAVTALSLLTVHEAMNIHDYFDWADMGVYGAAVALSYTLHRASADRMPAAPPAKYVAVI